MNTNPTMSKAELDYANRSTPNAFNILLAQQQRMSAGEMRRQERIFIKYHDQKNDNAF